MRVDDPIEDVGERYRRSRMRLATTLADLEPAAWTTPVPACPGWEVRDVLAHLVGVIEDAAAGRIQGPPDPDQTAAEVRRHRADPPGELLDQWAALAAPFESAISTGEVWPAFFDVLSHEHDIGGALGRRGPADPNDVELAARRLGGQPLDGADVAFRIRASATGATGATEAPLELRTTSYELFRLRLGRRTRDQALALTWSGDPRPHLDHVFIFGPALEPFPD